MPADPMEIDDVEDALRRADELSELTGRSKADVIADLLDDGQLNQSAGTDMKPDKDFLDLAQEKAEKLKTLLITIAPIIALLSGFGLEAIGVLDVTDWGEDSVWEGDPNDPHQYEQEYWGCMAWDAENYDPMANRDDGSCNFAAQVIQGCMDQGAENYDSAATEDDGSCQYPSDPCEGVTAEQYQVPDFQWQMMYPNDAEIVYYLRHNGPDDCWLEADVMISLYADGGYQNSLEFGNFQNTISNDPSGSFTVQDQIFDGLGEAEWSVETRWRIGNGAEECCEQSETITNVPEENPPTAGLSMLYITDIDDAGLAAQFELQADASQDWESDLIIKWRVWLNGTEQTHLEIQTYLDMPNADDFEFQQQNWTEGIGPGSWVVKISAWHGNDELAWADFSEVVIEAPVSCEVSFYAASLSWTNSSNNSLTMYSDPDETSCGLEVTVDVVWTIKDSNGTVVFTDEYRLNTTGESWDDNWMYSTNLSDGNYTSTLTLFYCEPDGTRCSEPSDFRWWNDIEVDTAEQGS